MESDDKSLSSSFDSIHSLDLQQMSAENQRQIDAADSLINNSAIQAIVDRFNLDNIARNHPLADDIENGVRELIKENNKLKDTLKSNNASMKRHFAILENWLEDARTSHKHYKKKLDEAKDVIGKLRNENSDLKKPMQEIVRSIESKFVSDKTKLLNENQIFRDRLAAMQQKLQKCEQISNFCKSEKEQDYQTLISLQRQLDNAERARRKLTLEVDRLNGQEMKLQQILSCSDSRNVTNMCFWNAIFPGVINSSTREIHLIESFNELVKLLEAEEVTFNDPSLNVDSSPEIKTFVGTDEEAKGIEQLKEEISTMRKQMLREQTICSMCKKRLEDVRSKFKVIHQLTLAILKEYSSKMRALEIALLKSKDDSKDITSLIHELSDKQNRIIQLESELVILQRKLNEAEKKNEDFYILQSQMKVYEEDYLSERDARESLANEKRKLEQDLLFLTQENSKLNKQLLVNATGDYANPLTTGELTGNSSEFICFNEMCQRTFATEEELQTHVYSCLNIKD